MSKEPQILVECECGLWFKMTEAEYDKADRMCDRVPENDLAQRKKKCYNAIED